MPTINSNQLQDVGQDAVAQKILDAENIAIKAGKSKAKGRTKDEIKKAIKEKPKKVK